MTLHICVEHQLSDCSYAVYIGGDGRLNRLFSYDQKVITRNDAREHALEFAHKLAAAYQDATVGLLEEPPQA
jgi:hypothetical protein